MFFRAVCIVFFLVAAEKVCEAQNRVAKATGPPAFFLQDAQSDGHCLAGGEFKRCGIDTLWYVTGKPGSYSLHKRKIDEEDEDLCLDKTACSLPESGLRLGHCRHCGAVSWNILGDAEQGYALTETEGKYCLKREGKKAKTTLCEKKEQVALALQFATRTDIKTMESPGARLVNAAADGDMSLVRDLITKDQVDVNSRDWDKLTAVVAAAAGGHTKVTRALIEEYGADPFARDKDNITALMEAAIGGHREVAELLLKKSPDLLNLVAASGVSALWLAAGEGKLKVAELLIKLDADVHNARSDGITALMAASSGGHTDVVKLLVEAGALVEAVDQEGLTALMNAAENGTKSTVAILLQHGADVDAASHAGFTPLIVAAAGGHTDACALLLDKSADMISKTHLEGVDALMYAAAGGHADTVQLLLERGADPKRLHAHGGSAFMEAATFGSVEVMDILLKHGADPLLIDDDGVTALMSAASQGKYEATKFLAKSDLFGNPAKVADLLDLAADSGGTAMMFAAAGGHLDCVKLLVEKGSDVNKLVHGTEKYVLQVAEQLASGKTDVEPHKENVTALQVAAQGGHLETVLYLLDKNAQVHTQDEEGLSALTNAVAGGHSKVAFALVRAGADPNDAYVDEQAKNHNLLEDAVTAVDDDFASLLVAKGASYDADIAVAAASKGLNDTIEAMILADPQVPNLQNARNATPLFAAANEGQVTVAKSLLKAQPTAANQQDTDGTTPLMAASVRGHVDIVKALIDAGASVNAQNNDGHTALMFAYNGKAQVNSLLTKYLQVLKNKQDTAKTEEDSNLDMINSALKSHLDIIQLLTTKGADPKLADKAGNIATDFDYQEPSPDDQASSDARTKDEASAAAAALGKKPKPGNRAEL